MVPLGRIMSSICVCTYFVFLYVCKVIFVHAFRYYEYDTVYTFQRRVKSLYIHDDIPLE